MFTRKSASTLSQAGQRAFVAAVLELKSKPSRLHPGDAERGRYDDFVEVHLNAMMVMNMQPSEPSWAYGGRVRAVASGAPAPLRVRAAGDRLERGPALLGLARRSRCHLSDLGSGPARRE